jgi:hypothetical protein
MDKKWKRKWVKALRSGEYKQAKGALKKRGGYCCLGVLCDVVKKELHQEWDDEGAFLNYDASLPPKVMLLVGLDTSFAEYINTKIKDKNLMEDNDCGKSFKQIANTIERYF